MDVAVADAPANQSEYGDMNPWVIAILVAIATFMEVLDTTIANVALRYISGGLAVSSDEASWVVTTYLVANSVVLAATGWIAEMFGRKNFFLVCIALFTISSLLCGFAWSLQALLLFRVMVVGPTLGGWLSDNLSWHWCFLINMPVGIICSIAIYFVLPSSPEKKRARQKLWAKGPDFDLVGFILVATFLGALEVVLDRGQIDDWFGSNFIVTFAAMSVVALLLFIPWELSRARPLIDLHMLTSRQFGTCFLVMLGTGALLIATTQALPQLLQDQYGYTATWAGLAISPGGAVTMGMMLIVGRLGDVQPRYLIAAGSIIAGFAMIDLLRMTPDADFWFFCVVADLSGRWLAADLHSDNDRLIRGLAILENRPSLRADQSGAQLRRRHGRVAEPNRAGATRTISSGTVVRECRIVESFLLR
jgi:MFS transporter, DHA2 family, multidrug resistance protein